MKKLLKVFLPACFLVILLISAVTLKNNAFWASSEIFDPLYNLEQSMQEIKASYPDAYDTDGHLFEALEKLKMERNSASNDLEFENKVKSLQTRALLSNPLLNFEKLIYVKRKADDFKDKYDNLSNRFVSYGLASNHETKASLNRTGWDNEIVVLSPVSPNGSEKLLYKPGEEGYVGEMDLHWDADKLLITESNSRNWKVRELSMVDGTISDVTQTPEEVHCYDAAYLPGEKVIFGSTAMFQSVPCWHGTKLVANLFTAKRDGSDMKQICFDQDHDFHPTVMNNGQVMYVRWDYTGQSHVFQRQIMVMNPDGTGQRAMYGTNTYFPNSLFYPQPLPGDNNKLISVLTGYHDPHKSGYLVVIDLSKGHRELEGVIKRISGKGDPLEEVIDDGAIQGNWPLFTTPFPLNDKYYLVSRLSRQEGEWEICIADIYDNVVVLKKESGYHLLEPIPVKKRKRPAVIPDKTKPNTTEGSVYLQNVYTGPGLEGVPKGSVTDLRVFAYNFGFYGLAGPHKIGYGGPWEAMRILGTVPVEEDGSAFFKVPANTPIAFQPIDSAGSALQLMRSWVTVMPGELRSCVGCHESPTDLPAVKATLAARTQPKDLIEWFGPARGFDFEREVQPVLDHYCVRCHNGENNEIVDLRSEDYFPEYQGQLISHLGIGRLHPDMKNVCGERVKYTPAYEELIKYVKRVGIEDDPELLLPGEHLAENSELIQMLRKGHQGIELNHEAFERLITWIDLNAPCHGTWGEVFPIPDSAYEKRKHYADLYSGTHVDQEVIPQIPAPTFPEVILKEKPSDERPETDHWPMSKIAAISLQAATGNYKKTVGLGNGISLELMKIPAGEFLMGDPQGAWDELPISKIKIDEPFWMGIFEITNEQYNLYDKNHDSKFFGKRHERQGDKGPVLNDPRQPVLRVSWEEAVSYCNWLSEKTGMTFSLPTEAQWEYACRAGNDQPLWYGQVEDDFTAYANMGDLNYSLGKMEGGPYKQKGFQVTGGVTHFNLFGADLADKRYDDEGRVTVEVGSYCSNTWGLFDMHGNVAEWTLSSYKSYPYDGKDGRNAAKPEEKKVVRGGSFAERPERCTSSYRLPYPSWQKVYNVGFRVVAKVENEKLSSNRQ